MSRDHLNRSPSKNLVGRFISDISLRAKLFLIIAIFWVCLILMMFVAKTGMGIISTMRAFVEGESLYVSGMKGAAYFLREYLVHQDEGEYDNFLISLNSPVKYDQARREMEKDHPDIKRAKRLFIEGGTHPEDVPRMIFLLRHFSDFRDIKEAIALWREANHLCLELIDLSRQAHDLKLRRSDPLREKMIQRVNAINVKVSSLGQDFVIAFQKASRWVVAVAINVMVGASFLILLLGTTLMYSIACHILRGIQRLNQEVEKIKTGDFSSDYVVTEKDEVGKLTSAFVDMVRKLRESRDAEAKLTGELQKNVDMLSNAKDQLIQSEKMAGIGQLAAGVAHEINNPTGFIMSNFEVLKTYAERLFSLLDAFQETALAHRPQDSEQIQLIKKKLEDIANNYDLQYLKSDLPMLIKECLEGTQRIKTIVANLKDFSRPSIEGYAPADINHEIDKALGLVSNEIKYKCEVRKEYGELPLIRIDSQQIKQAFINILINAAQSVEGRGFIHIKTYFNDGRIFIEFSDNGKGIPSDIIKKIFDPFFTTKDVGKGTGLGLSTAYGIVEEHNGTINVRSEPGQGTVFIVQLPVQSENC